MMVKKSDENSRALALNETVGENYSPTSRYVIIIIHTYHILGAASSLNILNEPSSFI
jgi:hypothetical protein